MINIQLRHGRSKVLLPDPDSMNNSKVSFLTICRRGLILQLIFVCTGSFLSHEKVIYSQRISYASVQNLLYANQISFCFQN